MFRLGSYRSNRLWVMCTPEQATDIFDSLPPVTMKDLHIGRWRADILRTGHPAEELMPALGWYGKQVISSREVQPFLFCTRGGRVFPLRCACCWSALPWWTTWARS